MTDLSEATADVATRDPVLANLIALAGPLEHREPNIDGHFGALARSIVFQQLAGRAASAILGRVIAAAGGQLTPEALIALPDETLRSAGLSRNKLLSLKDLSAKVLDGTVDLATTDEQSDAEITARLVSVRGIGPWSADMFLMFELRRLDIWPTGDLGVRQGYGYAWGIDPPPTDKELIPLGDRFRPYRSVVARYCWEAVALHRGGTDPGLR
jgi:DNA-3-methyladenine glycosylase II